MKTRFWYLSSLLLISLSGCNQFQKVADVIVKPTAREVYERNFPKSDSLFLQWNDVFEKAKKDSLQITLPYSESGLFSDKSFNAYSYNLQLKEGEKIVVEIEKHSDSALIFIDFFQQQSDSIKSFKLLKSSEEEKSVLSREIKNSGFYKIIVQPRMELAIPFVLKIYAQPLYAFPLSGGENKNIQSFWADPRDGGSRSHEGVDIFAKRGTPVLAVTDGRISSTGNHGLGGKQVWLSDGFLEKSIYYAHLDSIAVSSGKRVKVGDTLGFVGNTGNARTTPSHLHFGVYKTNSGAMNPLPFIKKSEIQKVEDPFTFSKAITIKNRAVVKKGPASVFEDFANLKKNDTILVLGKNQKWFHIRTSEGIKGFISETSVKPIFSN